MNNINYLDEWRIEEPVFSDQFFSKYESIMAMGNGYLGLRNCHEESYSNETRNMFVAGIFNKFSESEVTELANFPDISKIMLWINGKRFSLLSGKLTAYERIFNYKTGESVRNFKWQDEYGHKLRFQIKKFVSMDNKHLIITELKLANFGNALSLTIESGIDGTTTNSGSQHFEEGNRRLFEDQYLYLQTQTTQSNVKIAIASYNKLDAEYAGRIVMRRRQLVDVKKVELGLNQEINLTKYSIIKTSRDLDYTNEEYLEKNLITELAEVTQCSYQQLAKESEHAWNIIWHEGETLIESDSFKDALMLNFARYHMHIMSPIHDSRLNIGAKGMSGEGYKGHTFWDTEIFVLPYFTYVFPEFAKSLITYRIKGLDAAKINAKKNGYGGAQYPWESAWLSDGEVTPELGDIDIVTGKPTPILSGKLEQHVTGDVVFGVLEYLKATNDVEISKQIFDVLMETAYFWATRSSYNKDEDRYEILDVMGPDEYKEHVNNNAYTNYLAKFTLESAISAYDRSTDSIKQVDFAVKIERVKEVSAKLYLPIPNGKNILPQDDTYLQKKLIDLTKYLNAKEVNTLFLDYNLSQVNDIQVSKQADVILLMLLFPTLFDQQTLIDNWNYYFPKTLHDSSLSLCSHCNFALMLGMNDLAYELFKREFNIDLGDYNMKSSDAGVHAASMGGIWQNVVRGFGGFCMEKSKAIINAKLPKQWHRLVYTVVIRGNKLSVEITHKFIKLKLIHGNQVSVVVNGQNQELSEDNREITI
ncbi:glycoside hydrolase family 65 protein [Lapidilactobacillus bayanensis]|uniref:glycoside hydrolase family 65 protein n=1 Tax=Lapidilactobacillus bayanensis TaxID=2485998 RepID=UPI0013DDFD18|nr:glycoside hydrolase family 65 protein [Lapidilactobacillus bayanensis]